MATDLTTIFGTEINVTAQPREVVRQYNHFAGANGLTAMHLGSRGYHVTVAGRMHMATRALLETAVGDIQSWCFAPAYDYSFYGVIYYGILWDRMQVVPDAAGSTYHLTSEGLVTCRFIMEGRSIT